MNEIYPIFVDRIYTLTYGPDLKIEVTGAMIHYQFEQLAEWQKWVNNEETT